MRTTLSVRQAMVALYPRTHGHECVEKYRAIATWWRLHARVSADPETCRLYSRNQWKIAADMVARPKHHERKPANMSRWEWTHR